MSKTSQEVLVKEISSEMSSYLRDGVINPDFVTANLDYKGIDRIQDLETILKIHFVLSQEVVSFLEKLPRRIRRIKTESKKRVVARKGEVRGNINWGQTIVGQVSCGDPSLFVCHNPSKNYNVAENLVLKKLLSVIYFVLEKELKVAIDENYNWLKGLRDKEDLINHLKNIYKKNVHVNRIKDPEEYQVTDRELSIAENSRKELYKESAGLLIRYMGLMNGEFEEVDVEELLNETLLLPGDAPTVFELYAVFKLLKGFEEDFTIKKIDKGSKEIAVFEREDVIILVYHDSTGGMNFFEDVDSLRDVELDNEYLRRYRESVVTHADLIIGMFGGEKKSLYSGRPDILVEYYEDGELVKLLIGEVKYTDNRQTFSQGLKELIEYLYFARLKEKYVLGENLDLEGVLVVDRMNYLERVEEFEGLEFKLRILDTEMLKEGYVENY